MNKDIEIVLAELESEYVYLNAEMQLAIQELDFESATFLKSALNHIKGKLDLVTQLHNPNKKKISGLKNKVLRLQSMMNAESGELLNQFYSLKFQNQINQFENEIKELEALEKKMFIDSDLVYFSFIELLNSQISKFYIAVKSNQLLFSFHLKDKNLIMEVWDEGSGYDENEINKPISKLKTYGFKVEKSFATLNYGKYTKIQINNIMEFISVIFFEVFSLTNITDVYLEKNI